MLIFNPGLGGWMAPAGWMAMHGSGQATGTPVHRAIILPQPHQGAMFAFNAVPNERHGLPPPWMLFSSASAFPSHAWLQAPPHVSVEQPWTAMATTSCHAAHA